MLSKNRATVVALAKNHIGAFADMSQFMTSRRANIEGSYTTQADDHYSMTFVISGSNAAIDAVSKDLPLLRLRGDVHPQVLFTRTHAPCRTIHPEHAHLLSIYTFDKRGILALLSNHMTAVNVDIVATASCTYPAPESGGQLFVTEFKLDLSQASVSAHQLDRSLERIAADQGWWDMRLEPITGAGDVVHVEESLPYPPTAANNSKSSFEYIPGGVSEGTPERRRSARM